MSMNLKMTGFKEIERALAELPRGTSKGVARRVLKKELKPIAQMANAFWPGADDDAFKVTSRIQASQLSDSAKSRDRDVIDMFVGAEGGTTGVPHAHLIEFGTGPRYTKNGAFRGSVSPTPMLQPSWDMHKGRLLKGMGDRLWDEISKTQARRAKRAAN